MKSASSQVSKVPRHSPDRRVTLEGVRVPSLTCPGTMRMWSVKGQRRGAHLCPFVLVKCSRTAGLCRDGKRLDVPELGQEGVLIVVAPPRHNSPLLVEPADFAEGQRH